MIQKLDKNKNSSNKITRHKYQETWSGEKSVKKPDREMINMADFKYTMNMLKKIKEKVKITEEQTGIINL